MARADLAALREAQRALAARAVAHDALGTVRRIGGVDISASRFEREVHAAIVVLDWLSLEEVCRAGATLQAPIPYLTGLLGFREVPAAAAAWEALAEKPDLLLVDGQGLEHPRRCGVATHLGVTLDVPAVGVA